MKQLDKDFDSLWDTIIKLVIDKCQSEMSPEFIRKTTAVPYQEDKYKEELKLIYKRKVKWFKKEYLYNINEKKLDAFFIAAIVSRCVIGFKPICFDVRSAEEIFNGLKKNNKYSELELLKWRVDNDYVNYKIAFEVSLRMLKASLVKWGKDKLDSAEGESIVIYCEFIKRVEECDILLTTQSLGENSNSNNIVTAFMFEDILKRDFDYVLFANTLFQIQENVKFKVFMDLQSESEHYFKMRDFLS